MKIHNKTLFTAFILVLLFGSLLAGLNDNLSDIDNINIQTTKSVDNTLNDQTFDESIAYEQDRQYNDITGSWDTVTPEKPSISGSLIDPKASSINSLSLNSLPDPTVQYERETVKVDYQAKNVTAKSIMGEATEFKFIKSWSLGIGGQMTIDNNGDLLIVYAITGKIKKYDMDTGSLISQFGNLGTENGNFTGAWGIAVDSQNNIYVSDRLADIVQKFSNAGVFISKLSTGLFQPWQIAFNSQDVLYIADDNSIEVYTTAFVFVDSLGLGGEASGDEYWDDVKAIAIDKDDNIYGGDTADCNIEVYSSAHTFLYSFGNENSCHNTADVGNVVGIAIDNEGKIITGEGSADREVKTFYSDGSYYDRFGTSGTGILEFNTISDVIWDGKDTVLVRRSCQCNIWR
ncbi:MAG: hypothetical protein HeimC2_32150 [Candidatus Heimdallarchaeota archaeon LC_2]|nr:MAG: hypothetical protein HeimC2_32150 [Candidatus Heimdallarchaeota archaeon LC_2]